MKKNHWVLIILSFWLITLGMIVSFNEYTLRNGEEVFIKTLPVDPRDLFRGDYMILNYDISSFSLENKSVPKYLSEGDSVYTVLEKNSEGFVSVSKVLRQHPGQEILAIKGQIIQLRENDGFVEIILEYGIESFFIPEKTGRNFPMITEVKVAIDKYGNSKIKSVYHDGEEIKLENINQSS